MYKRILVPVDGSGPSAEAIRTAVALARGSGGQLRFVHKYDEFAYRSSYEFGADVLQQAQAFAEKTVADAVAVAKAAGVPADGKLLDKPGRLGELVADDARLFQADLVVVGTHGRRGASRALLGSGAEQVIRLAPVPVLAVRVPG